MLSRRTSQNFTSLALANDNDDCGNKVDDDQDNVDDNLKKYVLQGSWAACCTPPPRPPPPRLSRDREIPKQRGEGRPALGEPKSPWCLGFS